MGLLDSKERLILLGMAQGKSYREIGKEMKPPISERLVAKHVSDIFVKLGARDKAHAVALGILQGELTKWQQNAVTNVVSFTPREAEILPLMEQGLNEEDIAADLGLTPKTVRTHIERIFTKVGARTLAEAIEAIRQCGYLR